MRNLMLALALALAALACGGKTTPAPQPAAAVTDDNCGLTDGAAPSNAQQCECLGHQAVGDIGDGNVACPDGTTEVARIAFGIEGGVCCAAAAGE